MTEQNGHHGQEIEKRLADEALHQTRRERAKKIRSGKLESAKKRHRVLELRAAGLTEEEIGEKLGIGQARVSKILTATLKGWAQKDEGNVDVLRQQRLFELDQLKRAIWADALKGDVKAVREAIKIIQTQAKITGVEAPVRVERKVTVDIELDHREVDRMERAWLDSGGDVIEGVVADEID
jgi:predicted transcriptional regulator